MVPSTNTRRPKAAAKPAPGSRAVAAINWFGTGSRAVGGALVTQHEANAAARQGAITTVGASTTKTAAALGGAATSVTAQVASDVRGVAAAANPLAPVGQTAMLVALAAAAAYLLWAR